MSDNVKISQLASASTLTGAESVPLVQGGVTVRTLLSAIRTYIRTGLLEDAPSDGRYYARKDGAWVDITDYLSIP